MSKILSIRGQLSLIATVFWVCAIGSNAFGQIVEARASIVVDADSIDDSKDESAADQVNIGDTTDWKTLGQSDFVNVNCKSDTWNWKSGLLSCKGDCIGVLRTKMQYTNFEMVLEWKHLQEAGNSGVFIWAPKSVIDALKPDSLPEGIECQVLDHGYTDQYESSSGKKADWFTTNGDVFPVGKSKMKPFPPLSPNGVRSFPSANHSKPFGQWNHYYIRAINGEVRLWVNGFEVSGGQDCHPATGFVALESEGAPIDFRNIRIRSLP